MTRTTNPTETTNMKPTAKQVPPEVTPTAIDNATCALDAADKALAEKQADRAVPLEKLKAAQRAQDANTNDMRRAGLAGQSIEPFKAKQSALRAKVRDAQNELAAAEANVVKAEQARGMASAMRECAVKTAEFDKQPLLASMGQCRPCAHAATAGTREYHQDMSAVAALGAMVYCRISTIP